LGHHQISPKRGSSSQVSSGGAATFRLDFLIIVTLSILFAITFTRTVKILRPAFINAYEGAPLPDQNSSSQLGMGKADDGTLHSEYFSPEVMRWERWILQWSEETGLPPDLIAIVLQIESCGDRLARSSAGAMGIFQVMPFHFGAGEDPFDPETNARRGLEYLARGYAQSDGRIDLTLAGYNGGHSMIATQPDQWPDETQRYVIWGVGLWEDIRTGHFPSPTLERWLNAGGASLCSAASATAFQPSRTN
jgi:soluble lytic murein transglycosylase-like protein